MAPVFASFTLLGVSLLAMFPDSRVPLLPEKTALGFLFLTSLLALLPSLHKRLVEDRDAATFALLAAFFVLFHLADRAGPREGWALHFSLSPDDKFPLSYALRLAVLGALVSIPAWWKGGGPQRFIFAALILVGILGLGIVWYLSHFYKLGSTETLDPTPLPTLFLQMLGFGSIAALCRAVTASPVATRMWLRGLPLVLGLVGVKLGFFPAPAPAEDAQ